MVKARIIFCVLLSGVLFLMPGGMAMGSERNGSSDLRESACQVRRHVAYQLGEVKDASAVLALIKYLKDDDMHLRRIAARALGKIGEPEAVMPLVEVLNQSGQHRQVQLAAICSLGRIGDPRAGRTLEHIAEHEEGAVRQQAARNVGRLRGFYRVSRLVSIH